MTESLPGWVRAALRCPETHAELADAVGPDGKPELVSRDPVEPLAYPVSNGVPILISEEARAVLE
ncbi:MAG TPA: hypothetical protein VFC82_06025 [Actinomycetaceae bacterium]|nr:hypothetical protein [Actinomycetaceae bacterium]